ncbi:amino acid ABC transporter substrate-binding protein [Endozoicomonas sp. SM1973]|uniref:Amino acid ABC transporter substrate-binding protein n=1 Tax=Spartinivicinus marinus TaxID=2994442 RepID=A0A853IEV1_9GAMM|nr:transporter substrate-binding domain-containing protein [Spartinivicinus marinus]MCX4025285.1 transporter substrate-binding domain-containing protein [Spartinivicinus marinus]NYZ66006.1 amino acid ABC transporter substrate-binding protein [Spartinivicinus marinus]
MFSATPVVLAKTIETLKCGTNEFAPFGFIENGELKGIEVELFHEIGKRLNIQTKLNLFPWSRMLALVKKGDLDCMIAAFRTEERLTYMDYTNVPFHVSSLVFFIHQDRPFQFNRLEDLKGLNIGLVTDFTTSPEFDEALNKQWFTVSPVNDFKQNFEKLAVKRVDMVLVNRHVGAYLLKKLNLPQITALSVPLTARPAYLTFSKRSEKSTLIPKFDMVLFELLTDGTYQNLFEKYTAIVDIASPDSEEGIKRLK